MTTELGAPFAGTKQWFSGSGDDLQDRCHAPTSPSRPGTDQLSLQARWNIEDYGYDYLESDYALRRVDDGDRLEGHRRGNITRTPAEGNGIDGAPGGWTPATFDLSAYAGKTIGLRPLRHRRRGPGPEPGTSRVGHLRRRHRGHRRWRPRCSRDGAETAPDGWTLDEFRSVGATSSTAYDHFYMASNREYVSFDKYLQTGPYNFGFPDRPDFVEHFPYQDGLLVYYWDTSQCDNNTSQHPGRA